MLRSLSVVSNNGAKDLKNENERNKSPKKKKKANAWTEDEHKLFLVGLAKHGKGKWKNISLEFVKSRSPSQVASHAQKYFKRLNSSTNKEKRRSSIFDITIVPDERDSEVLHGGKNIMVDETINLQSGKKDEFLLSDFIDYEWEDYWFELDNFENLPIL